ncbi:MAG: SH3 domain-containing protein [Chloroflexaceae bacterium]|nr:SH3 domain-containing protein [Chloroflexaceae bacterium]
MNYPPEAQGFTLKAGDVVEVLSTAEGSGCEMANNTWFEIRTPDGTEGWVCSYYVNITNP